MTDPGTASEWRAITVQQMRGTAASVSRYIGELSGSASLFARTEAGYARRCLAVRLKHVTGARA